MAKRAWLTGLVSAFAGMVFAAEAPQDAPITPQGWAEGVVYTYVKDGKRHYSSTRPPANIESRQINYSWVEAPPAQTKWSPLYSDDNVAIDLDTSTAARVGDIRQSWTRHRFAAAINEGGVQGIRQAMRFVSYDCGRRTTAIEHSVYYSAGNETLGSTSGQGFPAPVVPDSVGEVVWMGICSR